MVLYITLTVYLQDYERYDPKAPGLIGVGPQPPAAPTHILPPSVGDDLDSEPGKLSKIAKLPLLA